MERAASSSAAEILWSRASELEKELLRLLKSRRDLKRAKDFTPRLHAITHRFQSARQIEMSRSKVGRAERDNHPEFARGITGIPLFKINIARLLMQAGVERIDVKTCKKGGQRAGAISRLDLQFHEPFVGLGIGLPLLN